MLSFLLGGSMLVSAVSVATRDVRVADLITDRVASGSTLVVLRLPVHAPSIRLSKATVAALLHRRVPGLRISGATGDVVITRRNAAVSPRPGPCLGTARDIAVGDPIEVDDLVAVPCDRTPVAGIGYDRANGVATARRVLPAGSYLGRVAPNAARTMRAGTSLTLRARVGPVVIERTVMTLQPAHAGGGVFVRDEDGTVSSAPLALEEAR